MLSDVTLVLRFTEYRTNGMPMPKMTVIIHIIQSGPGLLPYGWCRTICCTKPYQMSPSAGRIISQIHGQYRTSRCSS